MLFAKAPFDEHKNGDEYLRTVYLVISKAEADQPVTLKIMNLHVLTFIMETDDDARTAVIQSKNKNRESFSGIIYRA